MCGICGIYKFDSAGSIDPATLRAMTDSLIHRGPDDSGLFIQEAIGLGHRRLSIIDLAGGAQPMHSQDNRYVIVFNGEIYNYVELKAELSAKGHTFTTSSDTEVILAAYRQWGTECQSRFNGMWAFAIWDRITQQLFLSRDRCGEKPLYLQVHKGTLVFGSEIKSIQRYGNPTEINTEVTELYLSLGYIPAPYSFYKGIEKLPAGHFALINSSGIITKKYWSLPKTPESEMRVDKKRIHEEFGELLADAVKIRMRCDVPFGAFLSGGLDSGSIVALMSKQSRFPVETFTVGFAERAFDETALAALTAAQFGTHHHLFSLKRDLFSDALSRACDHFDEPFGDSSAIAVGNVSCIAQKQVKMVLTGDGADEVLAGYTTYRTDRLIPCARHFRPVIRGASALCAALGAPLSGKARYLLNRGQRFCDSLSLPFEERLLRQTCYAEPRRIRQLLGGSSAQIGFSDFLHSVIDPYGYADPFYQRMVFDLSVQLPDEMLAKVDRMSMAFSLETRLPFLDYRIVEMMAGVHKKIKLELWRTKSVLRNTVARQLPNAVQTARKRGFAVPLREWFKDPGFDLELNQLTTNEFGLDKAVIRQIVDQHRSGQRDYGNFIWALMVLRRITGKTEKLR